MAENNISLPQYPVKSDIWDALALETRPIVVYGMGNGADKLFLRFEKYGIKVSDIFASDGFTEAVRTHSNNEGMRVTGEYADKDFCGLCFLNLVDFDMAFGHRRDASGYAFALNEFDEWLANFIEKMSDDDVLVITADHGCDPSFAKSTDHTREYTPLIIYGKNVARKNLGTLKGFADIGATVAYMLGVDFVGDGNVIEIFE